jgi:hypothetical protein
LLASQSATVRNATKPANVVVIFVAVLAKSKPSKRGIQTITLPVPRTDLLQPNLHIASFFVLYDETGKPCVTFGYF